MIFFLSLNGLSFGASAAASSRRGPRRSKKRVELQRGFTLMELLVVLAIFMLVARFAWPELKALLASFQRRDALSSFEFDLRRARAEAMARGTRAIITIAGDGKSYSLGEDHLPYDLIQGNPDSSIGSTQLPSSVSIQLSGGNKIIFNSHGFLSDVTGIPRTVTQTITLFSDGQAFASATVYPVGVARFSIES